MVILTYLLRITSFHFHCSSLSVLLITKLSKLKLFADVCATPRCLIIKAQTFITISLAFTRRLNKAGTYSGMHFFKHIWYTHIYIHTCTHTHTYISLAFTRRLNKAGTYSGMHFFKHIWYTHIYIHTCTHTHTHTCTHI